MPEPVKKYTISLSLLLILTGIANVLYAAPPLRISGTVPNGIQYQAYSATLTGTNGTTPYVWSITAGSLPPGLSLVPSASPSLTAGITGTPVQTGTFSFTVTLTDSSAPAKTDTGTYSITVSAGNCTFAGTDIGGVSFNSIDPSTSPGPVLGTIAQQVLFTCKSGLPYTVTANPAAGWTISSGANTIPYTLDFITGGTGLGAASISLLGPNSRILLADYANAAAGPYANTQPVTLTISWTQGGGGSITATLPAGTVNGTVINTCAVTQSPGTMTFTIDPSITGTTSASLSPDLQIKCTNGDAVSVTATSKCGGAAASLLDSAYPACGGSTIPYTFNHAAAVTGRGFGGAGIPLNLGGTVSSADYENAPVGNYGDLQTLTITY